MAAIGDMVTCKGCQRDIYLTEDGFCKYCGKSMADDYSEIFAGLAREIDSEIATAVTTGDYSALSTAAIDRLAVKMLLTTETAAADLQIETRLGIVTAECVFGMNIFRDVFASLTDIVGGRSGATQKVLRDCRHVCLAELKREALMLGANGVVAINLSYGEISGGGKLGMILLVASGSAVKIRQSK